MITIQNEKQYNLITQRIEEILHLTSNEEPTPEHLLAELDLLGGLAEDYEEEHYPINPPTLPEILKLRMYEKGLTQNSLAKILMVSPSRISEYITGKSEPTLPVARKMCQQLDISASIILGVC
ncbi:MAG: helix-turn-helix domain-containing protein [Bacteroidetes bacterium]|nr:helix-turn-helix domain-containing protein [Bacteroidota bacterium]